MTPRRDTGDGSVYQDATGRWRGYVTVGWDPDGKQRRRYVSGPTRRVVLGKLAEARDQRDAGVETTKGTSTGEWLIHWLDQIAARTVRPSTLEGYTTAVHTWAIPAFGRVRLDRLTPEHLERLYGQMLDAGRAPATVRLTHRTLSRALQVAFERGRVSRNPAKLAHAPEATAREIVPFTGDEARRILHAAEGTDGAARWSAALALGFRQGEALGLDMDEDLDLGRTPDGVPTAVVHVRWALQRIPRAGLQLVPVKSRAGRRSVSAPPTLAAALHRQRQRQLEVQLEEGPRWTGWTTRVPYPDGPARPVRLLFSQRSGAPIDPRADHRAWEALLTKAGVRDARLHDARHTAATLMLEQGVPARMVMEILGHSQIGLTLGTYSHATARLHDQAAAAMESALYGVQDQAAPERPRRRRSV